MAGERIERASERKLLWAAALFVASLPILFHLRFISGDRILYTADTAQMQYPKYKILCEALQDEGQLPLWQNWLYAGSPFHANPENPTLYPPVLVLASFLSPVWTINLTALMHMALAGLGMFFLVRRLWMRADARPGSSAVASAGAIVAACVFSLSYWVRIDSLNLVAYGATHALIPWVLLAADSVLEGPHPRRAAGVLGLLFGFQCLTGGLYVIQYAVLSLAMWLCCLGLLGGAERARRALSFGTLAMLLAALIASGKYLPYQDWVTLTNRAGHLDYPESLGRTLGGKFGSFEWSLVWERVTWFTFFGTTLVLALLALPLLRLPAVRVAFGLVTWFILIGLGGPVHRLMYDYVPLFDHMRDALRAWVGVNAILPLLVGLGICGLFARSSWLRARPLAVSGLGVLIAALLAPFLNYSFRYQEDLAHPSRFSELPALYTNWPIVARDCGKEWRAMYVDRDKPDQRNEQFIATLLEVETPSGYLGHAWPRALEFHLYGKPTERLKDELRFRRRSTISVKWMVSTSHEPGALEVSELIHPANVDGNSRIDNPLVRSRAIEPSVVAAVYGDGDSEVAYTMLDEGTFPLQEASTIQLSRERELSAEEIGALDALIVRGELTPQAENAAAAMRANKKSVLAVGIPLSETDRVNVLALEHDLALAALEREPAPLHFERLRSDASQVTRTDTSRGRWIVVSEPWSIYAGWTARLASGVPSAIERADGVSSAVFVPAGESTLRADYAPQSARTGLWLYAAGVLVALLVALWPARIRS